MARLALNRDFSRFLEDETFPHRAEVHFGDKALICSGMVLAQQSSIIEGLIREDCGVLMFEKIENIGDIDQKLECIKFMYGAPLALTLQNIDTVIKFASLYGVMDLFHKSVQWLEKTISARSLFAVNDISKSFENEDHQIKLNKVISTFISKNINKVGVELAERIAHGDEIEMELFVSIVKQNPFNGANLLVEWTNKCNENKLSILEKVEEFDFVTLFPAQGDFTGFVALLSEGSSSVDVMKQVLALQQDYFVKSAAKVLQPPQVAEENVEEEVEEVEEEEDKDDNEEGNDDNEEENDDNASIASSARTTNSTGKPKSSRGGRNRPKKQSREEGWKSDKNPLENRQGNRQQKQKHHNETTFKPATNQQRPKGVSQFRSANQQKDAKPKSGLVGNRKIFVANVPSNATVNDIKPAFMVCGAIVNIDVHANKNIAFIEFKNEWSVSTALSAAKRGAKFTVSGQTVVVREYTPGKGSKSSVV